MWISIEKQMKRDGSKKHYDRLDKLMRSEQERQVSSLEDSKCDVINETRDAQRISVVNVEVGMKVTINPIWLFIAHECEKKTWQ